MGEVDNVKVRETRKFYRYGTRGKIEDNIKKGRIMSGVCTYIDGKEICIVYGKRTKRVNCVQLSVKVGRNKHVVDCGLVYSDI